MFADSSKKVVIMGAGPAGLTAAYQLMKAGIASTVLEKDPVVGGISRTACYKGYSFDIGGHRFFTKVEAVDQMWHEVLSDADFLRRRRLSRIYYNGKFFYYPLRAFNALAGLGIWNSVLILASYLKARIAPIKPEHTFEAWVSNRFGKRLYGTFFKTYTEKVWGIPCSEITAEWAAQRIKGLSLLSAIKNAIIQRQSSDKSKVIKTLIDAFDYPKKGPGMMWEAVLALVRDAGCVVAMKSPVQRIRWETGRVKSVQIDSEGTAKEVLGTHFLSTLPIRELIQKLEPAPPASVLAAAGRLSYRDFITVAVIVNKADLFPDNWIYIHDPRVKVGRIQNFKNWSPEMVPDAGKTCLGLEYFCFEGDGLWTMSDEQLVELAGQELVTMGLARAQDIEDGTVVRMPKAYPVYDSTYGEALVVVREFLQPLRNLQLIGRNGMHKYNNQDHSMLTAMLAVKNILGGNHNLWDVNVEEEYHEEVTSSGEAAQARALAATQPRVPKRTKDPVLT
jgi:protoporphyrinogen oxidase